MANLKEIKRRIGSVKNTKQITAAMKLVAAAKMRKAQENVLASRPYEDKLVHVLNTLAARVDQSEHPLLEQREDENILILVISADKGLCGGLNTNIIKRVDEIIHENEGKGIFLSLLGRKANDYFKGRNSIIEKSYVDYYKDVNYEFATKVAEDTIELFTSGKVNKVYLVYSRFISVIKQDPIVTPLLPITPRQELGEVADGDYTYEPSLTNILDDILKRYIVVEVYQALLESWASENGARMAAMDNATRNAGEMISKLTLKYNRARQAAITTEIIEIVSGANALKG